MQLRCGELLWPDLSPGLTARGPLRENARADVAVVGSGITGALVAYRLMKAGLSVVVVDKRPLACGSTPASTALLQYEIDTLLIELAAIHGRAHAEAAYRCSLKALSDLQKIIVDEDITCGLAERPSLYLATADDDVPLLQRESEARRAIGIDATFIDAGVLRQNYGLGRPGAIVSGSALEIDPWRFTHQLWSRCLAGGVKVFDQTELAPHHAHTQRPHLQTAAGPAIDCDHVVFATGYEAPTMFPELRGLFTMRATFALATPPVRPADLWPGRALIWERADPYLYLRTTQDNRVIVGGEDVLYRDSLPGKEQIQRACQTLLHKASQLIPALANQSADYAWVGTFDVTGDGLPYIGSIDAHHRCHLALGYGGNGITFSVLASEILRDIITGQPNNAAGLFAFKRRRDGSGSSVCT